MISRATKRSSRILKKRGVPIVARRRVEGLFRALQVHPEGQVGPAITAEPAGLVAAALGPVVGAGQGGTQGPGRHAPGPGHGLQQLFSGQHPVRGVVDGLQRRRQGPAVAKEEVQGEERTRRRALPLGCMARCPADGEGQRDQGREDIGDQAAVQGDVADGVGGITQLAGEHLHSQGRHRCTPEAEHGGAQAVLETQEVNPLAQPPPGGVPARVCPNCIATAMQSCRMAVHRRTRLGCPQALSGLRNLSYGRKCYRRAGLGTTNKHAAACMGVLPRFIPTPAR